MFPRKYTAKATATIATATHEMIRLFRLTNRNMTLVDRDVGSKREYVERVT
jgi:hypothetical protein